MPDEKVKISELPLAGSASAADLIPAAQDGTTRAIPVGLLQGPEGRLVFEWNGVDTSQFEAVPAFRHTPSGDPSTLSVETTAHGSVLRLNAEPNSLADVFLAVDPLPFSGTGRNMVLEFLVHSDDASTSASWGGPVFLANDEVAGFTGLIWAASIGNGASRYLIEEGAVLNGGSPNGTRANWFSKYSIRGEKPDGAPPYFTGGLSGYEDRHEIRRTGASTSERDSAPDFHGNVELTAVWNDLPCNRWGIMTGRQSGGAMASIDFKSIRIFLID